jgi:hypothetical protein
MEMARLAIAKRVEIKNRFIVAIIKYFELSEPY